MKLLEQTHCNTVSSLIATLTRMQSAGAFYCLDNNDNPIIISLVESTLTDGSKTLDVRLT